MQTWKCWPFYSSNFKPTHECKCPVYFMQNRSVGLWCSSETLNCTVQLSILSWKSWSANRVPAWQFQKPLCYSSKLASAVQDHQTKLQTCSRSTERNVQPELAACCSLCEVFLSCRKWQSERVIIGSLLIGCHLCRSSLICLLFCCMTHPQTLFTCICSLLFAIDVTQHI